MDKIYDIFLDNVKIGTTRFERADAPMGVVFGLIEFIDSKIGFEFLKDYCVKKQIDLVTDYPEDKLISTRTIDGLKVLNSEGFEISIEGIPLW